MPSGCPLDVVLCGVSILCCVASPLAGLLATALLAYLRLAQVELLLPIGRAMLMALVGSLWCPPTVVPPSWTPRVVALRLAMTLPWPCPPLATMVTGGKGAWLLGLEAGQRGTGCFVKQRLALSLAAC